jgi:hypothetical protein
MYKNELCNDDMELNIENLIQHNVTLKCKKITQL